MLFTDTSSLTYEIKLENVYGEFFKWKDLFDFSNYSKDSTFFHETNKNVIGKMKDEFGGVILSQFVGLKSKMYLEKNYGKEYDAANSNMFYLIKRLLDTKWKEFKVKSIN